MANYIVRNNLIIEEDINFCLVKAGQSYLSIESFVSLNLDLEHERMLSESN